MLEAFNAESLQAILRGMGMQRNPMKRRLQRSMACLMACLVIGLPSASPVAARSPGLMAQECGDFLARTSHKPANVVYIGCRYWPDRQGKPLQATYSVRGRFAAAVEAHLMKAVGLNRLKRSCCQWDSAPAWFKDRTGTDFSITMFSGETIVTSRTEWRSIPRFEIIVEAFSEEI